MQVDNQCKAEFEVAVSVLQRVNVKKIDRCFNLRSPTQFSLRKDLSIKRTILYAILLHSGINHALLICFDVHEKTDTTDTPNGSSYCRLKRRLSV